jgi:prolyl-tRNA synthetase
MRFSRYFLPTLKDNPTDAQIVSHRLMLRAGLVRQMNSGIYTWLPMGLRVLKNIESIIKQEQDKAGALELLMPTLQSADLWRESGRYDAYGPEMLRIKDRHNRDMLYGPTNEEMITDIFRNNVKSYKKLPQILYHTQWKFRDEIRPRFGVMRGREFLMKDAYSFDLTQDDAQITYQKMMIVYLRTFARLGLTAIPMQADTGPIGGDMSHEFLVLAPTGESSVYFDKAFYDLQNIDNDIDVNNPDSVAKIFKQVTDLYAVADEKYDAESFNKNVPVPRQIAGRGIEVGHIFYLGTKYSDIMGANVAYPDGTESAVHMGCYGIGVSRLMACLIEASHDDNGIIWNKAVAPFHVGLINLRQNTPETDGVCDNIYQQLQNAGITVLYHDTDDRAGVKFADMDLIGLPYQVVIGPNGVKNSLAEVKNRATGEKIEIPFDTLVEYLRSEIL